MKILVLGGTRFVGRHFVAAALEAGHDVTLFNRGRSAPGLFTKAVEVHGDREAGLGKLGDQDFDAVFDTSGFLPRVVGTSARYLSDHVGRYLFISTISVYDHPGRAGVSEDSPVATLTDPTSEDVGAYYGPLKAACERVVEETFQDRTTIVRPGLIVGPFDPTNRFTYWVRRIAEGGAVLAPEPQDHPVQVIDARDLGRFCLKLLEGDRGGVFNATGPADPLTFAAMLRVIREALGSEARFRWVSRDFLEANEATAWEDLPLYLPNVDDTGLMRADISRARATGLHLRPLAETARDILAWVRSIGTPPGEMGMSRERERELLAAADTWAGLGGGNNNWGRRA